MNITAGLAAGFSQPIASSINWQIALGFPILLGVCTLLIWIMLLRDQKVEMVAASRHVPKRKMSKAPDWLCRWMEWTSLAVLWMIFLGFAGGASFGLVLMFFTLRTKTAFEAAELSGFAQSISYFVAAVGPVLESSITTIYYDHRITICRILC